MPTNKKSRLPLILIILGIGLIFYSLNQIKIRNQPVSTRTYTYEAPSLGGQIYPKELIINKLELDLPITLASVAKGVWDNPEASVAYWKDSPMPGSKGNSVFYGHNWPNILGKLVDIQKGDIFSIVLSDETVKDFEVTSKSVVTADQTHILNQTDDARVTIYTCTGFLDSKRFVVVGTPLQ